MSRFTLYTYEDINEFNKFHNEQEDAGNTIHHFVFEETGELLKDELDFIIDISALVEHIQFNPGNKNPAIYNFKDLDDTSKVIIKSELANLAMEYFYTLFDNVEPLYEKKEAELEEPLIPFKRRVLYTYKNGLHLNRIIEFANENRIPFTNFSTLKGQEYENFRLLCNEEKTAIVDITTVVKSVKHSPQIIYMVEELFNLFPYYNAIVLQDIAEEALDSFRLLFEVQNPVSELLKDIELPLDDMDKIEEEKVTRIIDLNPEELRDFYNNIQQQLFGHDLFKIDFQTKLDNFILMNNIKMKKIFSVFLLGNSGLGKTEFARIVQRTLNKNTSFIQINFGNYSSKDALNSLIGSPKGYIGCEDGELSVKVDKSKAGIILCDEFEKATLPVFNFFLELLEEGVFTDSMSREYNLDGYIIIFTSNLNKIQFKEHIPPEFQSRLDFIREFNVLVRQEKIDYVKYKVKEFSDKIKVHKDLDEFSDDDREYFRAIIDSTDNLRDIERMVRERILSKINESG